MFKRSYFLFFLVCAACSSQETKVSNIPNGFVDIKTIDSSIQVEARYFSEWNFRGERSIAYQANKCYLEVSAATALADVQKQAQQLGYSLLVFDCYRPQKAVSQFVAWVNSKTKEKMKAVYYPGEERAKLIQKGYIASRSGHSRGATLDLSLIKLSQVKPPRVKGLRYQESFEDCRKEKRSSWGGQVNMGTIYDCFSVKSSTEDKSISKEARANRLLLRKLMSKQGFHNYSKEWWHYTYRPEPFKEIYFDFTVH